ncbi:Alpha/Beta hydrolase protein [Dichotomopilus funicola]|uniref:Alpha/Beta hydrolase protein n=1 Tax=Dichotomopilus funicola TaxID=1934379 RepID=A0AAN6V2H9_9PEZI|nr:Alpha/Beta hydrolase protein [Dichotomopilus funicola]
MAEQNTTPTTSQFGTTHVIEPASPHTHTHTAIMLHGRGSNGPEFAQELAETAAPGQKHLLQRFPSWRWVFPSSQQEMWSIAFEETLPAWFEAHSLTDTSERQDLQISGIKQSVAHIQAIVDREVESLGGEADRVVIMGISQGGAVGMWTLLCQRNLGRRVGAFVGASTWLPFARYIQELLGKNDSSGETPAGTGSSDVFVRDMLSTWLSPNGPESTGRQLLSTPVFLGHGNDDAFVGVDLGQEARKVLDDSFNMDVFDTGKPDRLHQSLSSAWGSFLSAQHCSHEVNTIRRTLDEHIHQANLATTSLQKEVSEKHEQLATAVAELKSEAEQCTSEIKEVAALRATISTLQQKINKEGKEFAKKIADLSKKVASQQEGLDGLRPEGFSDSRELQEKFQLGFEKVETLQEELKETRAEKLAAEERLAALESRMMTITGAHENGPGNADRRLKELLSRYDDLIGLLDPQPLEPKSQNSSPSQDNAKISHSQARGPASANHSDFDIRSLYLVFREKYKTYPPRSDTAFIWQFLNSIKDPVISKHIQESIAVALPDYVLRKHRRRTPRKFIEISKALTWRMFREVLVKIPGPA